MSLARHVGPPDSSSASQLLNNLGRPRHHQTTLPARQGSVEATHPHERWYLAHYPIQHRYTGKQEISKFKIPEHGAPADAVHQMLKDELDLDGRPNLNLASFVGTNMETHAEQLMFENISKNMSDADEYPAMMQMHANAC